MRVLLIGGGGREHALAWKLTREEPDLELIAAPGNPGIAELGECVPVNVLDIDALERLARERAVDLTVVGPEAPLEAGIVDRFRARGMPIFGPTTTDGIHVATGLGSRGLLWGPIGAELLACQLAHEPLPLGRDHAGAVSPRRFLS